VLSGSATERSEAISGFVSGSIPVLVEPLVKLLVPVAKLVSPGVSLQTRYLPVLPDPVECRGLGVLRRGDYPAGCGPTREQGSAHPSSGGPVCRDPVRKLHSVPARPAHHHRCGHRGPWPFMVIASLIPFVGDLLLLGLGLPLVIFGGAFMAVFLVGLVGYPLMYPTLSVEGDSSDTFDALSRSINYVYQAPWHYLWYWFVAVIYGAAVTFFILFFTSLMVYTGKWAVGLPAGLDLSRPKAGVTCSFTPRSPSGGRNCSSRTAPML
jgi:hypothetical protein